MKTSLSGGFSSVLFAENKFILFIQKNLMYKKVRYNELHQSFFAEIGAVSATSTLFACIHRDGVMRSLNP